MASATLLVVAVVTSLVGWWVHGTIVDDDGWNTALGDVLDDDEVAAEVATIVTERTVDAVLDSAIDVPLVSGAIEDVAAGPARDVVEPVVGAFVRSELASTAWRAAVASVHDDAVAILRDESTGLVDGSVIRLDLRPLSDRLVERIDEALGPFGSSGVGDALDVDLEIVLYDLSEHDTSLRLGSAAERMRLPMTLAAVTVAIGLVIVADDRPVALISIGGAVAAAAALFRFTIGALEPAGLEATWSHVVATADGVTSAVILLGVVVGLAGVGLWMAVRTGHPRDSTPETQAEVEI